MKKTILATFLISVILISFSSNAQTELWGMTSEGGYSKGVIFKTDSCGSNYSIQHYFENREKNPKGTLIKASNGKYYGMSDNGGDYGLGCIFEYDSSDDSVFILHHFDGTATGSHPKGDLLEASNGKLYGMTNTGGTGNNRGVVFELDPSDNSFTKIYEFGDWPKGRLPYGSLIEATNGRLYGMTREGGNIGGGGYGTIFEIDLGGPTLTILYTFTGSADDGSHPLGNLLQVNDSLLYGFTPEGGAGTQGTVFKFNIDDTIHTKLYDFDGITGSGPRGSPVAATNGNLYGVFNGGSGDSYNGGIFEYDIDDSTLNVSYDFGWTSDHPSTGSVLGSLVEGEANMLFGMTNRGGANDDGALFKYNCASGTFTKLYDFSFSINDNANVYGSLIESSSGKFLGMTNQGGTTSKGTIFEYDTTTTHTIKHSFNAYSHGENPNGSLVAASNGKFYGLTVGGGKYNAGTLFEYDPLEGIYIKWHDFDGTTTGANPYGSLIEALNGKMYGMTKWGGSRWGVLFEFDPGTGVLSKLHDFIDATGTRPCGSLLQASNGKLYGMTSYGGAYNNYGVLFEYDISAKGTYTVKVNFEHTSERDPESSLIEANSGILYGLSKSGGASGYGTIFEYDIAAGATTVKYDLNNTPSGKEPTGDLIKASNGKLYGMTPKGGTSNGTLFEFDTLSGNFIKLYDFNVTTDGINPYGSLIESSNGKFYGMTSSGGTEGFNDKGVLFEYDTVTHTFAKKLDFSDTNGSNPIYTQLVKIVVTAEWTGTNGTDWHNPANWLQNAVPGPFTEVTIPDISTVSNNFPVVSSNTKVRKLTINDNATLNVQTGIVFQVGNQ